jgi:hypothetical protein
MLTAVGTVLGIIGFFRIWLVVPTAVLGVVLVRPRSRDIGARHVAGWAWVTAVAIAVVSVVINSPFPSEQVIGGRDGATYLATGASLADAGSLLIDAREGAFADAADLEFGGPGFFDSRADGRLSPQFLHGLPALLAAGKQIGGDGVMLRLNALLGGLALMTVFAFGSRLVGPWFALLAELALSVNLVFAFYARAPYSEILAMVFVYSGLWFLWRGFESQSRRETIIAGAMLGGSFLARIDSLVLLVPLVGYLAFEQRSRAAAGDSAELTRGVWLGLLPVFGIAMVDLVLIAPDYLANQSQNVIPLLVAVGVIVAADAFFGASLSRWATRLRQVASGRVGFSGAALVLAAWGFFYVLRPEIQEAAGNPYLQLAMDPAELALGEGRSFAENSARWLGWYLGPVAVVLGFLGWAALTRLVLEGRRRLAIPFLLLFSSMTLLYLWRPSINPDHIWAMRRFLPVALPGLIILAGFFLAEVWASSTRRTSRLGAYVAIALAALVVTGSLLVFLPRLTLHEFQGLATDLREGCETFGDDAALLFVDSPASAAGSRLASTYRSHCGLPAAYTANDDRSYLEDLRRDWASRGKRLWLLSVDQDRLREFTSSEIHDVLVGRYEILELTFTRRPSDLSQFEVSVFAAEAMPHA